MLLLLNLLKIFKSKFSIYLVILLFVVFIIGYFYASNKNLQIKYLKLEGQLKQVEKELENCNYTNKQFKENVENYNKVIQSLKNEIKSNSEYCIRQIKDKQKLINELNKVCLSKPKDIKPKVIIKKECKLKIETKESLNEKDSIFNVLSNIGK